MNYRDKIRKYIECPEFYQLSLDTEDYEVLYDLIKADLVEKVEDK